MPNPSSLIVAGTGGIGEATAYMLLNWADFPVERVYILDSNPDQLAKAQRFIGDSDRLVPVLSTVSNPPSAPLADALARASVVLDCLPGALAPTVARLALDSGCHYANLTEYVAQTNEIKSLAEGARTGFLLQTGLAPGTINVLAHSLLQRFEAEGKIPKTVEMKVGALTRYASPPHYYGFTWSPIGVATEYVEPAVVIRDGELREVPSLSERGRILIDGVTYEDDLTSGGAADMPERFAGKLDRLDYKTLRYPGHYEWVVSTLKETGLDPDALQRRLEAEVPREEEDVVIVYASVEGHGPDGTRHRISKSFRINPVPTPNGPMRAIQATTASALAQSAKILLSGQHTGPVLQMDIDPGAFLNGVFIKEVYR